MTQYRARPKTTAKVVFVPGEVRTRLERLHAHLHLRLTPKGIQGLRGLVGAASAGSRSEAVFSGSSKDDSAVGVELGRLKGRGRVWVDIEYRRGMVAPHPKVVTAKLVRLEQLLNDYGRDAELHVWEETRRVPRSSMQQASRVADSMLADKEIAPGVQMRMTGVSFAVLEHGRHAKDIWVFRDGEDSLLSERAYGPVKLAALEEMFRRGDELLARLSPATTPTETGTSRGRAARRSR